MCPVHAWKAAFRSVRKITTATGPLRFDSERDDSHGHADAWWAYCLAEQAALGTSYTGGAAVCVSPSTGRSFTSRHFPGPALPAPPGADEEEQKHNPSFGILTKVL